jgi:hypothetical protein
MIIEFSRYSLNQKDGFKKEHLIQLLNELPEQTTIRGFAERPDRDNYAILLAHDSFPELEDGSLIPRIDVTFTKNYTMDGSELVSINLKWPESYKTTHACLYKNYEGFQKTEEICTICGKVK